MPLTIKPPEPPQGWDERPKKKGIFKSIFSKKEPEPIAPIVARPDSRPAGPPENEMKYAPKEYHEEREAEHVDNLRRRLDHEMRERAAHVSIQEQELKEKEQELKDREKALRNHEKLLRADGKEEVSEISRELIQKEAEINEKEKKLRTVERELAEQQKLIETLERELKTKKEMVKSKAEIAERIKKDSTVREGELQSREDKISEREVEIEVRIKKIRELEKMYKSLNMSDLISFDKLLNQKEKILEEKELHIQAELSTLKKREASQLEKHSVMNMRETKLDAQAREIARARRLYNANNLQLLAKKEKLIDEKEKVLEKKETEILQIERRVRMLEGRLKEVDKREMEIRKKETEISVDRKIVDEQLQRYHKIISERENMEMINDRLRKKAAILAKMEEEIRERVEIYNDIVKKSPEIKERVQGIMKKEKILNTMEVELRKMAASIKEERDKNNQQVHDIQEQMKTVDVLNRKEQKLAEKEKVLLEMEEEVKDYSKNKGEIVKYIEMLNKEKVVLENRYETYRDVIDKYRDEREYNWKELQGVMVKLKKDASIIEPAVHKLKEEIAGLDRKENEILDAVDEMERRKKLLDKEEERVKTILAKVRDLDKDAKDRERSIKLAERNIERMEKKAKKEIERIQAAKGMKKEIPKLTRVYNKLKKDILKIDEEALAKRESLRDFESKLYEKEHILNMKEKEIMAQAERIKIDEHEWSTLEKVADAERIYKEIKTTERLGKDYAPLPKDDLLAMIENARVLIDSQKTGDAEVLIQEIEKEYKNVDSGKKRLIGYEIMELKNELKLASLA